MKILNIATSPEPCVEAGWHASQYSLDGKVTKDFVLSLKHLGSLLLLENMRQPFFKIESHHYMIKGLLGDSSIRVALHRDYEQEAEAIKSAIMAF